MMICARKQFKKLKVGPLGTAALQGLAFLSVLGRQRILLVTGFFSLVAVALPVNRHWLFQTNATSRLHERAQRAPPRKKQAITEMTAFFLLDER